jgi:hypothetical protein
MRATGLLMAALGGLLLVLTVAPAPAEACPSRGQAWREAPAAPLVVVSTAELPRAAPVIALDQGSCEGAAWAPPSGRRWSCHRRAGQGALGFVIGFSSVLVVAALRRRWYYYHCGGGGCGAGDADGRAGCG